MGDVEPFSRGLKHPMIGIEPKIVAEDAQSKQ
jgi:hypothetical protein